MSRKRLIDIDRSKGFAIVLVVLGHFADHQTSHYVPNWYFMFKYLIYSFHMPFFMFLSGVVVSYSQPNLSSVEEWGRFISKKFWRLMPAYFVFGCLVFLGKTVLQKVIYIDNANQHFVDIFKLIIFPTGGPAQFLWYIYVLFEMCCIYPVIIWGIKISKTGLLAVALILLILDTYLKVSDFLGLDMMFRMFFFFVFGVLCGRNYERYSIFIDKFFTLFLFAFCTTILLRAFIDIHFFLMSILAIPACLGILRKWDSKMLIVFGRYCFSIYLMHLIFIGLMKGITLRLFVLPDLLYSVLFIVCIINGICLPILVKKYVFRYIGWLNSITD